MNPSSGTDVNISLASGERDEEILVRQALAAREGDLRPFERLVRQYQRRVIANCRYITRDPNNAEDLAQEVMVKVFFGLRTFEGKSSFQYWLQRIKVNHCLTYIKKQEGWNFVGVEEEGVDEFEELKVPASAEQQAEAIGGRQHIGRVLDAMSNTLRIPLILCDMDGLSYEEVANTLGISLSAAKMRIKRAREDFRQRYQGLPSAV